MIHQRGEIIRQFFLLRFLVLTHVVVSYSEDRWSCRVFWLHHEVQPSAKKAREGSPDDRPSIYAIRARLLLSNHCNIARQQAIYNFVPRKYSKWKRRILLKDLDAWVFFCWMCPFCGRWIVYPGHSSRCCSEWRKQQRKNRTSLCCTCRRSTIIDTAGLPNHQLPCGRILPFPSQRKDFDFAVAPFLACIHLFGLFALTSSHD